MDMPPCFSASFIKGDNFRDFLFSYQEDEVFIGAGQILR